MSIITYVRLCVDIHTKSHFRYPRACSDMCAMNICKPISNFPLFISSKLAETTLTSSYQACLHEQQICVFVCPFSKDSNAAFRPAPKVVWGTETTTTPAGLDQLAPHTSPQPLPYSHCITTLTRK